VTDRLTDHTAPSVIIGFMYSLIIITKTSGQSNLTKRPQCCRTWTFFPLYSPTCGNVHPHLTHTSLGPPESIPQMASRSVQPLLHSSWQCRQTCLGMGRPGPQSNTRFLGPTRVHIPNGILIGSAIFAGLPNMDSSVVFEWWHQCAPDVMHTSLGPPKSTTQTAFQSVQPFLHN